MAVITIKRSSRYGQQAIIYCLNLYITLPEPIMSWGHGYSSVKVLENVPRDSTCHFQAWLEVKTTKWETNRIFCWSLVFTETEAHVVLAVESSQDNKVQLNRPAIGGNPPKMGQEGSVNKITTITYHMLKFYDMGQALELTEVHPAGCTCQILPIDTSNSVQKALKYVVGIY